MSFSISAACSSGGNRTKLSNGSLRTKWIARSLPARSCSTWIELDCGTLSQPAAMAASERAAPSTPSSAESPCWSKDHPADRGQDADADATVEHDPAETLDEACVNDRASCVQRWQCLRICPEGGSVAGG